MGTADGSNPAAVLYDSVSGWPVGPIFEHDDPDDAHDRAEGFQRFVEDHGYEDIRACDDRRLHELHKAFVKEHPREG